MDNLTRAQRDALRCLRRACGLWPSRRGRYAGDATTPWSRKTLQSLVDLGLARWVEYPPDSVMLPHIVPVDTTPDPRPASSSEKLSASK